MNNGAKWSAAKTKIRTVKMRCRGFYFVLSKEFGWEIALYHAESDEWFLAGTDESFYSNDFEEINENRIKMPSEE